MNKYKIILKKDGSVVGDLGEYESESEANQVAKDFNIKFERRSGKAHVQKIHTNPKRKGLLLFSSRSNEEESESESSYEEESESSYEEESSEDIIDSVMDEKEEINQSNLSGLLRNRLTRNETTINPRKKEEYRYREVKSKHSYTVPLKDEIPKEKPFMFAQHDMSVQAVIIDDSGFVLLREPLNQYRGIRWDFAGGTVESGETIQDAISREVKEETGYTIELVGRICHEYISGRKMIFYLARPLKRYNIELDETKAIYFVSQEDAYDMLGKNKGQHKTLYRKILDKAFLIWKEKNI